MSDLREQLLKAGLVSDAQAKEVERQQRKQRKQKGAKAARREAADKRQRYEAQQQDEARRERERARAQRSDAEERELQLRIGQIVASNAPEMKIGGRKRWYYESRTGRVPYLELSDKAAELLESGAGALVQSGDGKTSVVTAAGARKVVELDDRWVVFWKP